MNQNRYPYTLYRTFGPSLTSNLQGMKRPLGASTLGNQPMLPLPNTFDDSEVSYIRCPGPAVREFCSHGCHRIAEKLHTTLV